MLAIQANEQGAPVLIESYDVGAGKIKFREVDNERWTEILEEGLGDVSDTPQAIVPITTAIGDPHTYESTVAGIKARGMTQMPAIVSKAVERAMQVGCFKDNDSLVAFVSRRVQEIANKMEDGDLQLEDSQAG